MNDVVKPDQPGSVLFCCDHNSVRSPMAEAILKAHIGKAIYAQSAGVVHERDIDGFAVAVCKEIEIELERHQTRSFEELSETGDEIESYDLIIAMSPKAYEMAKQIFHDQSEKVEYWPIADPMAQGDALHHETRDAILDEYRKVRDSIHQHIVKRFPI